MGSNIAKLVQGDARGWWGWTNPSGITEKQLQKSCFSVIPLGLEQKGWDGSDLWAPQKTNIKNKNLLR